MAHSVDADPDKIKKNTIEEKAEYEYWLGQHRYKKYERVFYEQHQRMNILEKRLLIMGIAWPVSVVLLALLIILQ